MVADIVFLGLSMGTFYALIAVGLSAIFGVLRLVNFAHGEFFMIGAYAYSLTALHLGFPLYLSILFSFAIGAVFGVLMERLLMRPLYSGRLLGESALMRDEYAIIITFSLSIFLVNVAAQVFGPFSVRGTSLVEAERVTIGPITTGGHRVAASLLGIAILVLTVWLLRYTPWGKTVQAVAQNRFGASINGINTVRVTQVVFGISGGLASLSGALLAPIFHADPFVGELPAVKSFVIVVLGGMGSVAGAILGAYVLGIVEQLGGTFISSAYRDAYGFVLLIAVLLLRPQGIFGQRAREV